MKTFPTVVILLTLLSTSLDLPGKIDPRRVRTMQKYSYSNWCGHTRMAYPRLVQDWYLPDLSLLSCSATNIAKQIDVSILRASGVEP